MTYIAAVPVAAAVAVGYGLVPTIWLEAVLSPAKYVINSGGVGASVVIVSLVLSVHLLTYQRVPSLDVPLTEDEAAEGYEYFGPPVAMDLVDSSRPGMLQCYDPATSQHLGEVPIVSPAEVRECIKKPGTPKNHGARQVLRLAAIFYGLCSSLFWRIKQILCASACVILEKTQLGASFGEVLPTCEKIQWLIDNGEAVLSPEQRAASRLMMYKRAWVEFHPVGVIGVISPFNYPFTNFMNHILSGLLLETRSS